MPIIPLACPYCGGSLTVDSNKDTAVCDYCDKPYIVKDAIVQNYISNVFNIDTVNVIGDRDFIIKAGVLIAYNGASPDVVLPDNLKSISPDVFSGSAIEKITISDGIKEIPDHAFENCAELKEVVFPDTLETIGASAFCNCSSIERLEFPESIKLIRNYSFQDCSSLETVIMPKEEEHPVNVEICAFAGCSSLNEVYWENHTDADIDLYFGAGRSGTITNKWKE